MSAPTTTAPFTPLPAGTVWTKEFAKASDAELSRLLDIAYATGEAVDRAESAVIYAAPVTHHSIRNSRGQRTGKTFCSLDGGQSRATVAQVRGIEAPSAEVVEALAKLDAALVANASANQAVSDHDKANYQGWQRFFLVSGGHIHSSTSCHSLYPTTRIGWLPELSGETEAEAVAAHGALLCTHCFPTAPVEWTDGRKADDDLWCAGGGTWDYPRETARMGYCTGNYGVCTHCNERITITSTGKMRKHKKPV